jgi:hypothetical protein
MSNLAESSTLYEISSTLQTVIENGIVFDEETGEVFFDAEDTDALSIRLADKLEGLQVVSSSKRERAKYFKEEAKRLNEAAKLLEKSADSLDAYALKCVEPLGKIQTDHYTISTRKCDSIEILDATLLPSEYVREKITTSPDKTKIKEAIKNGKSVPGAAVVKNVHLSIR